MVHLAPLLHAAAQPCCQCRRGLAASVCAPHAARMDGYATTAASGLMGLIFSLSTVGKVKGLASGSGHPAVRLCWLTARPATLLLDLSAGALCQTPTRV